MGNVISSSNSSSSFSSQHSWSSKEAPQAALSHVNGQDRVDEHASDDQDVNNTFPKFVNPQLNNHHNAATSAPSSNMRRSVSYHNIKRWTIGRSGRFGGGLANLVEKRRAHSNGSNLKRSLSVEELAILSRETQLKVNSIDEIYHEFKKVCESSGRGETNHRAMDRKKYLALDKRSFLRLYSVLREEPEDKIHLIADLTFRVIPKDLSGRVQFRDFLLKYVRISNGSTRVKLECTYEIYDLDKKGYIEVNDVKRVIDAMLPKMEARSPKECDTLTKECMSLLDPRRTGRVNREDFIEGLMDNYSLRSVMCPYN